MSILGDAAFAGPGAQKMTPHDEAEYMTATGSSLIGFQKQSCARERSIYVCGELLIFKRNQQFATETLVARGTILRQCFAQHSVCGPSRVCVANSNARVTNKWTIRMNGNLVERSPLRL